MTKRTKRVLFYSAIAVFLVSSYIVILYAQGYKYSFSENKFFKTGAIYLKVNTDADVYVDDKLLGNTSFFSNSYRIEGLLPGKYVVRIQRDGYSTWQKLVMVDEGYVSEFSKILLVPTSNDAAEELKEEIALIFPVLPKPAPKPTPTPTPTSEPFMIKKGVLMTSEDKPEKIAENVKGFILSKDKNKLAWWTANEVWVEWLSDTGYQPYRKKGDKELVTRFSTQIKKAAWFRDEDHLIVGLNGYKIVEIDTRGGINIVGI